jgi:hypothetical protein
MTPIMQEMTPARKRRQRGLIAFFIVVGLIATWGIFAAPLENRASRAVYADDRTRVEYRVAGTTTEASVTIKNSTGATEQHDVTVPWKSIVFYVQPGDHLYLSAQNSEDSGTITCEIRVNGKLLERAKSSGRYVSAICSGLAA